MDWRGFNPNIPQLPPKEPAKMAESKCTEPVYSLDARIRTLVDDESFSDVCFCVGEEKKLIRANKSILRLASSAFESMFFGDLKENADQPVDLPDETPNGFLNVLKYIYSNQFKDFLKLTEIHETFMAGDKYLVDNFNQSLFSFIKKNLNESNCLVIYDQLLKSERIQKEGAALFDEVQRMIRTGSNAMFSGRDFVKLSQQTLISVLKTDWFSMKEIEVVKACSKWIDCQLTDAHSGSSSNVDTKQKLFEPLKPLIRWSGLTAEEVGQFGEDLSYLLKAEEIASLFLHCFNKTRPNFIRYTSPRKSIHGKSKGPFEFCPNFQFDQKPGFDFQARRKN